MKEVSVSIHFIANDFNPFGSEQTVSIHVIANSFNPFGSEQIVSIHFIVNSFTVEPLKTKTLKRD